MKDSASLDTLKSLIGCFLPEGILDYFEVVKVEENTVPIDKSSKDTEELYGKQLDVFLDERDNRTGDMNDATSDGFTKESKILDFPIRDHKTILHIRRRRWSMPDKTIRIVNLEDKIELAHPGTRYAKDFAHFLKTAFGQ